MTIRTRLFLLFLLTTVLIGAMGFWALMFYRDTTVRIVELHEHGHQTVDMANQLRLQLQIERTTWKNTLLRGQDPREYHKNLRTFYEIERRVRGQIIELQKRMAGQSKIKALIAELQTNHLELGRAVRQALQIFNTTEENPHQFADRISADLETRLHNLVDQIAAEVERAQGLELQRLDADQHYREKLVITLLLVIGAGCALLFFWALDRNVGKPAEQAAFLANYDPLTKLPNRTLFQDRLRHAIDRAERSDSPVTLLFFDLDHFKAVNDALGHKAGDELLKQVGRRLLATVRHSDTPARLGGDEFAVIVEGDADEAQIAHIAQNILQALNRPFLIGTQRAHVSASIGITRYPQDGREPDRLLQNADAAMYLAKNEGRDRYHFFTEELNQIAEQRLALENLMREAAETEAFELHYQPQLSLADGSLVGVEALLRFEHEGRYISPEEFVPVLEQTGLINSVGLWVLKSACSAAAHWRARLGRDIRVAVNLSPRQLQDPAFAEAVADTLHATALPGHCLEMEITEGSLVDTRSSSDLLYRLEQLGVRIAIDDFGTGYSSLSYLKRFSVDVLKIDRSFIRDITRDDDDDALTSAIIALSQKLDIEVVAEGVETIEQQAFLSQHGCDVVQGFLFSRPLPSTELETWMLARESASLGRPLTQAGS